MNKQFKVIIYLHSYVNLIAQFQVVRTNSEDENLELLGIFFFIKLVYGFFFLIGSVGRKKIKNKKSHAT